MRLARQSSNADAIAVLDVMATNRDLLPGAARRPSPIALVRTRQPRTPPPWRSAPNVERCSGSVEIEMVVQVSPFAP